MLKRINKYKLLFIIAYTIYLTYIVFDIFSPIYSSNFILPTTILNLNLIINISKQIFPITTLLFSFILSISISKYLPFLTNNAKISDSILNPNSTNSLLQKNKMQLLIGDQVLNEQGLYQNLIITGSIGTGKTSGLIFPSIQAFLNLKIPGIILDVKGNMYKTISQMNNANNILIFTINSSYKYNPLDKPLLPAHILAQRLVQILELFSNTTSTDTYWYDKAQELLCESIKLIRLYNNNYVTFIELNKIIFSQEYLLEKIEYISKKINTNSFSEEDMFNFKSLLYYFKYEYTNLDNKILSTIKSEASRIINPFICDIDVQNTFCPDEGYSNNINLSNLRSSNTIILLSVSIGKYQQLSKIIAAYLKLDFQYEVFNNNENIYYPMFFICDEYQEYVTSNDPLFFSLSREFKIINIIATQSYSSLLYTLKNDYAVHTLLQNFVNKVFLRTDDNYTIEYAQKLFGKEDKIKQSSSFSENAQETKFNYFFNKMQSKKSNISESYSTYLHTDNIFDSKDFSLNLHSFEAIAYLSDGEQMYPPQKVILKPYFRKE